MLGSILFTPFNLSFWGELNPATRPILHAVTLSPWEVLRHDRGAARAFRRCSACGSRTAGPDSRSGRAVAFRPLSLLFFVLFVLGALVANWDFFLKYVGRVVLFVFLLNAFALLTGYFTAAPSGCAKRDRRAVAFEVGIQNSGFGLVLVFNFFGGLGGMAIVAAWWGIWHILVGTTLASIWWRLPPARAARRPKFPRERSSHLRHGRGRLPRPHARRRTRTATRTPANSTCVVASDVREVPSAQRLPGVEYVVHDVRDARARRAVRESPNRHRRAPGGNRDARREVEPRTRVRSRRARHAQRARGLRCAGRRADRRHLERRGVRLPRR